ncbi:MAG TPA: DinB family protein [Terriglobales bacterium]|jgi:uncharacterized damage-inducible protein DinB
MTASSVSIAPPQATEYAPYYEGYISLVPAGNIVDHLERQIRETTALLSGLGEDRANFRYAPGKWSVKQLVAHICDGERIMAYRALRFSRNDQTPIEGYEQDDYVQFSPAERCSLAELVDELVAVRRTTVQLFRALDEEAWARRGVANENEMTVRALAYVIAGHELHHRKILKEKYL